MKQAKTSMRVRRLVAFICLLCATAVHAQQWTVHGGAGGTKYSALTQINKTNAKDLKPAWSWKPGEVPSEEFKTRPGSFEAEPLMIGGVLYLPTPYSNVVALDAQTGKELWRYDTKAVQLGHGQVSRRAHACEVPFILGLRWSAFVNIIA